MRTRRAPRFKVLAFGALLSVAGASVLTGVVAPTPDTKPHLGMHSQKLGSGVTPANWSSSKDLGIDAEMVGFTWTGGEATLDVRAVDGDGDHQWATLRGEVTEGPDSSSHEATPGRVSAGPAWLGHGVRHVEIRVTSGAPTDLELHALESRPPDTGAALGSVPAADAAVPMTGIISRAEWGADESWRTFAEGCDGKPDYATDTRFAVVHHTAETNSYSPADVPSILRGIYYFHTHTNGWCDIGYNFLVDRYGNVYEGRAGGIGRSVIGAHSGGFNTYSTGVAVLGDFTSAPVPQAAYDALRRILAWKMGYHGINPLGTTVVYPYDSPFSKFPAGQPVVVGNLVGHGDVDSTSCPGARLYALLPRLAQDVAFDIYVNLDTRVMGDWNADGVATPGVFKNGMWFLRNSNTEGGDDGRLTYGDPGDFPIVGDWNGDGVDTVGVYRNGTFFLRNTNTTGVADIALHYGDPGDFPVVGDWNGDGVDTVGVYRNGVFYLRNSNTTGIGDVTSPYGNPGDIPVAGDWNHDGTDTPGVYRGGTWYLRDSLQSARADRTIAYGNPGDWPVPYVVSTQRVIPVSGAPLATHTWGLGIARGSYWFLTDSTTSAKATTVFPY